MSLPILLDDAVGLTVSDPTTGEFLPVQRASDHALLNAVRRVAELDSELLQAKRTLAAELRDRYGAGASEAGGFAFTIAESQTWPVGPVKAALADLLASSTITEADAERCMPSKPKPDGRQMKALIGRLTVSDPEAARVLAEACTVSPPSVRDVRAVAVDEAA